MINERDRQRVGRARLLRRDGKTYDEIRAVVGEVGDDRLRQWLRGIPRPPGTWRTKPKTDLRTKCRQLRASGLTYDEITEMTGASAGSLSLWLSGMPHEFAGSRERRLARLRATCALKRADRAAARSGQIASAAREIGAVSDRNLFMVGLALYWAEGGKSKPWAVRDHITFINSDPTVITVFMRWLDLLGVDRSHCRFHVSIHETADVPAAESYWAGLVGVDSRTFNLTSVK